MLRRAPLLVVTIAIAAACGSDSATGPSFRDIVAGIPSGWQPVGTANNAAYVVGVDRNTKHGGSAALAIYSIDSSPARFEGVGQFIQANAYRGKRIKLAAWVRQLNIVGSDIGLWMRVDGPGETQAFDNFSLRPLIGTSDWHQVQVILDVPQNAIGIAFGALMSGRGEFWVDDMTFEVIAATGPTTDQFTAPAPTTFDAATFYSVNVGPRQISNLGFEP